MEDGRMCQEVTLEEGNSKTRVLEMFKRFQWRVS